MTADLLLDHPRLAATVKTSAAASPRWEIVAFSTDGNLIDFDGDSGEELVATLTDLFDEPVKAAHIELTLWMPL